MAAVSTQVRRIISDRVAARLTQRGFTVGVTTITGQTDGLLAKLVVGGKAKVTRMKKLGIRA